LSGGETLDLGGRKLQIIHTPGHSPGSICIYEQEKGHLFTGDTLYKGTLYMNYESTDPVAFAHSIHTLASLNPVAQIFPGHHEMALDATILEEADSAFTELKENKKLEHGSGLHTYKNINILI
jgi:glyoxylase-like metal-dependent hydrolase (beta-lactamase superfamily II)